MSRVFISYRHGDSAGHTGRLLDSLEARFGAENLFRDIESLQAGVDFPEALERALSKCEVVLVMIGRQWASAADSKGRRLDQPEDFVRMEVASALARADVSVIPVLVDGGSIPEAEDLPEDLRPLARRNAIELSDTRWEYDVGRLSETLGQLLGLPDGSAAAPRAPASAPTAAASRRPPMAFLATAAITIAGLALVVLDPFGWRAAQAEPIPAGAPSCQSRDADAKLDASGKNCLKCPESGMTLSGATCERYNGNGKFPAVKIGEAAPAIFGSCMGGRGSPDATIPGCWSCRGGRRTMSAVTADDACIGQIPPTRAAASSLGPPACPSDAFASEDGATCLRCPEGTEHGGGLSCVAVE